MGARNKPKKGWLLILMLIVVVIVFSLNCTLGELFVQQLNTDRTNTSFAIDTVWAATYTEEATQYNIMTATSYQATEDVAKATHDADMKTYDAQLLGLTETAAAPKPPTIISINFPKEINGNKSTYVGLLYFKDSDGDIKNVNYDVVSAVNFGGGIDNEPKLDHGTWEEGAIKIYLWCEGQQTVTLRATIYDWANNPSNSMDFTFTCK